MGARILEACYKEFTDEQWLTEILMSFNGYRAWVLKDPEYMRREGDREGCVIGPDGNLHYIDWKQQRSKWLATSGWNREEGATAGNEGSEKEKQQDGQMISADGQFLGDALVVNQPAIEAAEK